MPILYRDLIKAILQQQYGTLYNILFLSISVDSRDTFKDATNQLPILVCLAVCLSRDHHKLYINSRRLETVIHHTPYAEMNLE